MPDDREDNHSRLMQEQRYRHLDNQVAKIKDSEHKVKVIKDALEKRRESQVLEYSLKRDREKHGFMIYLGVAILVITAVIMTYITFNH